MRVIHENPDKPWDWKCLSCKQNLDLSLIDKYPNKQWDYGALSTRKFKNSDEFLTIVNKLPHKNWCIKLINDNYITLSNILKYPCIKWSICQLEDDTIDVKIIEKYPHLNWGESKYNSIVPFWVIDKYPLNKWHNLTYRSSIITLDEFIKYKNIKWNSSVSLYTGIYSNKNILQFVEHRPDYCWNWKMLTRLFSIEYIYNNIDRDWDWKYLSTDEAPRGIA